MAGSGSTITRRPARFCRDQFRREIKVSLEQDSPRRRVWSWMPFFPFGALLSRLRGENLFSWGLSSRLMRLLPPLSDMPLPRNVFTGKFAMKSVKQNGYVTGPQAGACGARIGHGFIQPVTPASFQS
jgi:hypothetical protein